MGAVSRCAGNFFIKFTLLNYRSFTAHFERYFFWTPVGCWRTASKLRKRLTMVCTPFVVVSVCLLAGGGAYKGRCCCCVSLSSIAERPNAGYEIGAPVCTAGAAAGEPPGAFLPYHGLLAWLAGFIKSVRAVLFLCVLPTPTRRVRSIDSLHIRTLPRLQQCSQ